jgi:putative FmdB family regulatory protein
MPTYIYECAVCGHRFELFQKMSDAPAETCPSCGGKVNRIPGPGAGFIFKGSGFYATDYRSRDYKSKAKAESGGGAGESKGAGGSEGASKPKESGPAKESGKTDN